MRPIVTDWVVWSVCRLVSHSREQQTNRQTDHTTQSVTLGRTYLSVGESQSWAYPLPSSRHHRSNGDCLEGKRENYQVCFVQYCVQQLCTVKCTHIWTALAVLWIGFCLTGLILLCLDSFLYCVSLYIACMCRFVTWWGGPGGIEACPYYYYFLQCFDTVGWVIWSVKNRPRNDL